MKLFKSTKARHVDVRFVYTVRLVAKIRIQKHLEYLRSTFHWLWCLQCAGAVGIYSPGADLVSFAGILLFPNVGCCLMVLVSISYLFSSNLCLSTLLTISCF